MPNSNIIFQFNPAQADESSNWQKVRQERQRHLVDLKTSQFRHAKFILPVGRQVSASSEITKPFSLAQGGQVRDNNVTQASTETPDLTPAYTDTGRSIRVNKMKRIFKGFMAGGVLGLAVLVGPILAIEGRYRFDQLVPEVKSAQEVKIETEYPKVQSPSFQYLLNQKYLEILKPVDPEFSIIVPKLSINSKVVPNVSVADKKEYEPALKMGAAHAKGTYFPGENGTTYIFAHSTNYEWFIARYNAIFYLLKDLEPDDQIHLVYKNTVYPYKVVEKKIVGANDIEYLTPHKGREELILQTCYPPGTTEKRLLVIAHPTTDTPRVSVLSYSLDKKN